ncbi:hypothetical protein V6N11_083741 [Hibiscus sabdariffa]|uniref:Uncharacterized protein n=1 Tax=Hibiscus sabdariffa TaxID=183260 RepID=A0ABR2QCE9_9ROSI
MLRLCSRWSGIDCMVALDSPDDGSFISEQGALHGAIMPVGLNGFWPSWGDIGVGWFLWCIPLVACLLSDDGAPQVAFKSVSLGVLQHHGHQRTWPIAETWWLELRYTADSAGHGGRKGVSEKLRKEMTPWARNLGGKLTLRLWPHATLTERWLSYDSDPGRSPRSYRWAYSLPFVDTADLSETMGVVSVFPIQARTSTEPELLVATLVHTISQDGNGSRCWLNVYITRLGSHRIDQDRGAMSKHPDRVNAGQSVTEGAV